MVVTSAPCPSKRWTTALSFNAWFNALFNASTTGAGVFAGAKMAYHWETSTSSIPCSFSVGNSGISEERLLPAIPTAFSLPFFNWGMAVKRLGNITCVCPATVSLIAGADPLYGT
ncbi:hypothetical protein D3C72_1899700 [compost metagenome]